MEDIFGRFTLRNQDPQTAKVRGLPPTAKPGQSYRQSKDHLLPMSWERTDSRINHYFSPMNVTRRHSYVCAKCHEGANNSYATYVVHSPNPVDAATHESFPMLYAFWIIAAVAVGTFAIFLPHTLLWGWRDLLTTATHHDKRRRIKRFSLTQRLFHFLLMLSFLIQAATGFSRMFIETQWGRFLASLSAVTNGRSPFTSGRASLCWLSFVFI